MTHWPVSTTPVPEDEIPTSQLYYQTVTKGRDDPIFVWGTEVDVSRTKEYLREVNETADVLVSPTHVLLRAVAWALKDHPQFNRRLAGRKLYQYHTANLIIPARDVTGEIQVLVIEQADQLTLTELAESMWSQMAACHEPDAAEKCEIVKEAKINRSIWRSFIPWMQKLHNRFNFGPIWGHTRLRRCGVYVNSLDFRGAPPMTSYKPSRFPSDLQLTTVTQGPVVQKVIPIDGKPEIRDVAPLYVRSDHRAVDAYELGEFITSLCRYFSEPWHMDEAKPATSSQSTAKSSAATQSVANVD